MYGDRSLVGRAELMQPGGGSAPKVGVVGPGRIIIGKKEVCSTGQGNQLQSFGADRTSSVAFGASFPFKGKPSPLTKYQRAIFY